MIFRWQFLKCKNWGCTLWSWSEEVQRKIFIFKNKIILIKVSRKYILSLMLTMKNRIDGKNKTKLENNMKIIWNINFFQNWFQFDHAKKGEQLVDREILLSLPVDFSSLSVIPALRCLLRLKFLVSFHKQTPTPVSVGAEFLTYLENEYIILNVGRGLGV